MRHGPKKAVRVLFVAHSLGVQTYSHGAVKYTPFNVSRPYFVELLEKGAMPFRKVGTHRRVLLAYKQRTDRASLKALDELSALDQKLGLAWPFGGKH